MKDYTNNNPLYFKALDRMPNDFSSHSFMDRLRLYKIGEHEIKGGKVIQFLLQNCTRLGRSTWRKNVESTQTTIQDQPKTTPSMTNYEMITHLKSEGYKVLKPTWDEL